MKQQLQVDLYGAASVTVEGVRHSKLWTAMPADSSNDQVKGLDISSLKCDPKVFDDLSITQYPATVTVDVDLRRGAKNSMVLYCTGVHAIKSPQQNKAS